MKRIYESVESIMKLNEKTLWQNIKSGNLLPVYLIKGEEGYLKQKYATLLAGSVVPAGLEAFNFHRLAGENTNPEEIGTCVEALPAMCEKSCVFVHDFDFDGANETEKEELLALLSDLPDTCVLIFWQDTKGFSTKTKLSKEILSAIDKNGAVCTLEKRDQRALVKFVVSECEKRDRSISFDTALYFVNCVGDDMSNIINEIDKVCAFSSSEIKREDIDKVAVKSLEATAFQMIDSMLSNNFEKAFFELSLLFERRTEPTMILGALVSTYADMYRIKLTFDSGHKKTDLKAAYPVMYKNDFKLNNAAGRARRFSLFGLRRSLDILAEADFRLKSSFDDNRIVFEKLIVELSKVRAL